jgi:hypothetical protein
VGKPSQRKGRAGEHEAWDIAEPFGLSGRVHNIYEAHDITIEGYPFEVKRCEQLSLKRAYDALESDARGLIARCNRHGWIIAVDYKDWLEDQAELKQLRSQLNKLGEPQ